MPVPTTNDTTHRLSNGWRIRIDNAGKHHVYDAEGHHVFTRGNLLSCLNTILWITDERGPLSR